MNTILITTEAISIAALREKLADHPCCGALVSFEGIVRNENEGKPVAGIVYECYEAMAKKELTMIVARAHEEWAIHQVVLAHRIGELAVGEVSLVILITAPHRNEAFAATEHIIAELKARVPIWKQEVYESGHKAWIGGTNEL